jgi:hypothetical protein
MEASMRQKIVFRTMSVMAVVVVVAVLASASVGAQGQNQQRVQQQEITTMSVDDETATEPTMAEGDIQDRINKYKEKASERVSAAREARLQARCQNAQTKLTNIANSASTVVTNRQAVYQRLIDRVAVLSSGLQAAGIDVSGLEASVTELQGLLEAFTVEAEAYQVALNDLGAMDCESDPTGFQAALSEARRARGELFKSSQTIREYVQETVRPIIVSAREALTANTEGEESTDTNPDAVTNEIQE